MSQETIKQLRTWIAEQGLDALLITQAQNRSYVSGWLSDDTESGSMLLVGQQQQIVMILQYEKNVRYCVGDHNIVLRDDVESWSLPAFADIG